MKSEREREIVVFIRVIRQLDTCFIFFRNSYTNNNNGNIGRGENEQIAINLSENSWAA